MGMLERMRWTVGLVVVLAVGCGVDPGDTSDGGAGGAGAGGTGGSGGSAPMCPDDPMEGPILPECAIWVSVSLGDDDADGTQDAPVATLTRAIELAEKGPRRVYACNETWAEVVVVPGTVSLHGGFRCEEGWTYSSDDASRAMLVSPSPVGLTWAGTDQEEAPFLSDFYIQASDAEEPGGFSFGLFVLKNVRLTAFRAEIRAGNGADGLDGENGSLPGEPAAAGAWGTKGADACSAPVSAGGVGPENACEGGVSKGGDGGEGGLMTASNGATGEPIDGAPAGEGGWGEQLAPACTPGTDGAVGKAGEFGNGGQAAPGTLDELGARGVAGKDGLLGSPGQGGGGGGATFGSVATCGSAKPGGAGGGSGGAGGCGGKGGKGGQPGGMSFGIASLSEIKVWKLLVAAGNGGKGGNGGAPQNGGAGGLPGAGGAGAGAVKPGCPGGKGGNGGDGGWGGGGSGGDSTVLAFTHAEGFISYGEGMSVEVGKGGDGGFGAPNVVESRGSYGSATVGDAYN